MQTSQTATTKVNLLWMFFIKKCPLGASMDIDMDTCMDDMRFCHVQWILVSAIIEELDVKEGQLFGTHEMTVVWSF